MSNIEEYRKIFNSDNAYPADVYRSAMCNLANEAIQLIEELKKPSSSIWEAETARWKDSCNKAEAILKQTIVELDECRSKLSQFKRDIKDVRLHYENPHDYICSVRHWEHNSHTLTETAIKGETKI